MHLLPWFFSFKNTGPKTFHTPFTLFQQFAFFWCWSQYVLELPTRLFSGTLSPYIEIKYMGVTHTKFGSKICHDWLFKSTKRLKKMSILHWFWNSVFDDFKTIDPVFFFTLIQMYFFYSWSHFFLNKFLIPKIQIF